jgi:hypothetical protein
MEIATIEGKKYITAVYRGTSYTLSEVSGDWFVSTRRLALGNRNVGGGKYYCDVI